MKTSLIVALSATLTIVMLGCEAFVEDQHSESVQEGYKRDDIQPFPEGVYITAVDYDAGYDWRRDTTFGLSGGSVNLYRDSTLLLSIPAGPGKEVSLDADKHHFVDGHLYTEYCSSSETVIKQDGKEIFRYEGAETLRGLLVRDDDVYTLGQGVGGQRVLSLRKNGEVLLSKEKGTVWGSFSDPYYAETGALYEDEGVMYFAFYTSYKEDSPLAQRRFYLVKNQTVAELWFEEDVKILYDMRMIGGVYTRIVGVGEKAEPCLYLDDLKSEFSFKNHSGLEGLALYPVDGRTYMYGRYADKTIFKRNYTRKWSLTGSGGSFDGAVASIRTDGDDTVLFLEKGYGEYALKTPFECVGFKHLDGYFSPRCMEFCNGEYYVINNPGEEKGTSPELITSGGRYTYRINGILTSVTKQE